MRMFLFLFAFTSSLGDVELLILCVGERMCAEHTVCTVCCYQCKFCCFVFGNVSWKVCLRDVYDVLLSL